MSRFREVLRMMVKKTKKVSTKSDLKICHTTYLNHRQCPTSPHNNRMSPQALSSRRRVGSHQITNMDLPATKRTRQEHQDVMRTIGSGQGSCKTHQNVSTNARNKKVGCTHLEGLKSSQTSRAPKQLYQATSMTSINVLGKSSMSMSMKQMHQVEIEPLEAIEASRRCREPSRAIQTAQMLSTTPDMMEDIPEAMGTSALRQVRGPGGYLDEQAESGDVGDYQTTQSGGDGIQGVGKRGGKNGTTSSACRDSQRVETRPLAGDKDQFQQVEHNITPDVPEASTPPPNDPKRPVELPNLLHRQGRMKLRPRKVNRMKTKESTHRIVQPRRGQITCTKRIGDVEYEVQMLGSLTRQDTGAA